MLSRNNVRLARRLNGVTKKWTRTIPGGRGGGSTLTPRGENRDGPSRLGRAARQLNWSRDDRAGERLLDTVNPIARSASGNVSFQRRSYLRPRLSLSSSFSSSFLLLLLHRLLASPGTEFITHRRGGDRRWGIRL